MFSNKGIQNVSIVSAGFALFMSSCGVVRPTSSTGVGLVVTGSSQAAVVAQNSWSQKILNFFVPQSLALTPTAMASATAEEVLLSNAWIRIKEFEFKMAESEATEAEENDSAVAAGHEKADSEIKFKGPYVVDLLSSAPSPIDAQALSLASYKRIKFKIHHEGAVVAPAPAELDDHSIYLQGSVAGRVFNYLASDEEEIEIAGPNGVTPTETASLLLVFKFSELFAKIDLSSVVDGETISSSNRGVVANACPLIVVAAEDLYSCFRKGLKDATKFGRDDNDDHDLDSTHDAKVED